MSHICKPPFKTLQTLTIYSSLLTNCHVSAIHFRPRLSEQLGVSLLCTDHTVCVSHPLQSDLQRSFYPNNLVSLYSVLTILYVSHIHVTRFRPRINLSEQLGVSLLCTGHTVCVSHPLQSDLVYPNNLVSLYSVTILYVSHIHCQNSANNWALYLSENPTLY